MIKTEEYTNHGLTQIDTDKKKLPEGWEWKKLGEVCEIKGGGTPSKSNKSFYNGEVPWATVRDMRHDFLTETEFKISNEAVQKSSTNIIESGNVIIATRVGLGKVCILEMDTAINQDLKAIIPKRKNEIDASFLFHWFKSITSEIVENGTGATVKGVKLPFINSLKIPLPPLPEQKRIVAILDEAFTSIDKAKTNAEKNLANAKKLFESYLNGVFANPGEDWEEKKLGEVCKIKGGGTPSKKNKSFWNGDIPWVSPKDMKQKDIYDTIDHISRIAVKESATNEIPKNSILIVVRSGILSHKIPLAVTRRKVTINQDMKALLPQKVILTEFLYYHLKSIQTQILSFASRGATVHRIPAELLESIVIKFPSLSEQECITSNIESLISKTKQMEDNYKRKISALDELKKSILKKAFEGEL